MQLELVIPPHSSSLLYKVFSGKPNGYSDNMFATTDAGIWSVQRVCEKVGVSKWQLASLLGCSETKAVYRWAAGKRVPSPVYLIRMLKLCELKDLGMEFEHIQRIDWDTVTPIYKRGHDPEN